MIWVHAEVQCCFGRPFSEQCLTIVPAQLTIELVRGDDGVELLQTTMVRIDPAHGWYDKAGVRHLYCPEHRKILGD